MQLVTKQFLHHREKFKVRIVCLVLDKGNFDILFPLPPCNDRLFQHTSKRVVIRWKDHYHKHYRSKLYLGNKTSYEMLFFQNQWNKLIISLLARKQSQYHTLCALNIHPQEIYLQVTLKKHSNPISVASRARITKCLLDLYSYRWFQPISLHQKRCKFSKFRELYTRQPRTSLPSQKSIQHIWCQQEHTVYM